MTTRNGFIPAVVSAGIFFLAAWSGIASALAPSSAGLPDPTFGTNGVAIINPTAKIDQLIFGAMQPDGKFVGAGDVEVGNGVYAIGVVRYLDNGLPDPSFAVNGIGTYGIDDQSYGYAAQIAPDGKIYVFAGVTLNGKSKCAVLRLLANGQLDASFGSGGVSRFAPSAADPTCYMGALLPDGKILVSGYADPTPFVVRLNTDGTLDTQFGTSQGYAFIQAPIGYIFNMALDPASGRIAVFGEAKVGGQPGVIVVLRSTGALDTGFNGTGYYNDAALLGVEVLDGKFLADGRLVATGNSPNNKPAVWRFNANGTPDPTFGSGGIAERMQAPVTGGWGRSIVIQPDGKYVIGIRSLITPNAVRYTVLRLLADGSYDASFGNGGQTVIETGNANGDYVFGTYLGPDGKIWLSGIGNAPAGDQAFMVARVIGVEITTDVIEFNNSILNHYFITADPIEAAAIEGGAAGPGWTRTGRMWKSGGPNRVCRFYGSIEIDPSTQSRRGPNSHFYTIDPLECAAVKLDAGWHFESYDFSGWPKVGGACPAGTVAVLRVYNGRFAQNDSNHRYTIVQTVYDAMIAQGWIGEGIVFCAVL